MTPTTPMTALRGTVASLLALTLLTACTTTQGPLTDAAAQTDPLLAAALVSPYQKYDAAHAWSDALLLQPGTSLDAQNTAPADARDLARKALTYLGIKYRYGGKTPNAGFDCSGLVVYAAEQTLGLRLPHHAATMARMGVAVKRAQLQEGDLVFFNTRGKRFSHMGIYLGDHQFVHAPRKGAVVRVERMDTPYWQKRYNGARRLDTATLAALPPVS